MSLFAGWRRWRGVSTLGALVLLVASCSLVTDLDGLAGDPLPGGSDGGGEGSSPLDGAPGGDFTDDRLEGQFGAGTFSGTRWVTDHVELEAGKKSGDFVSRIFDASDSKAWKTLRWDPGAPYGKALPDRALAEKGYRASSFDMASNVLLLHFDDALVDSSPTANGLAGTGLGGFVPAVFGKGLADSKTGYVYAKVTGSQSVFNFGTDSVTWSMWAKSSARCPDNAVYMGIENPSTGFRPHLWLGCTPQGADTDAPGVLGDTFCSIRTATNDCADANGAQVLTNGAWHHMAIVKSGHANALLTSYLDGVLQATTHASYQKPIVFDDGVQFAIGAFSDGSYPAEGTFDEVAIWRRALDASEILALYRRGAQRLTLQVRACNDAQCTNVAFGEPGLTDPANALGPPQGLPINATGRFVQYKVHFESDDATQSPALYAVSVGR